MGIPNPMKILCKTSDQHLIYYFKIHTEDPTIILSTYGLNLDKLKSIDIRNVMLPQLLSLCTGFISGTSRIVLDGLSCVVDTVPLSRAVCHIAGVLSIPWVWMNTILCNLNRQKEKEDGLTDNQQMYSKQMEVTSSLLYIAAVYTAICYISLTVLVPGS
jgi:hypothetical protein